MMNFKSFSKPLACVLFSAAWFAPHPLQAQTPSPLDEISFVGDVHQQMPASGGATVVSGDEGFFLFDFDAGTANAFATVGNLDQAGVDGYAQSPPDCVNAQWYSLDTTAMVSGVTYRPADVFQLFGAMPLDSRAAGVPDGVNVDAISMDPVTCDLVFSIDVVASLAGVVYKPDDLIRWDGTTFSIYRFLNFGVDIDALHIISDSRFLFSIESDGLVPGMVAQDDDVIESIAGGPGSFQVLAFSPRLYDSSWIASDLVALSARVAGTLGDQIFADGFED